MTVVTKVTLMTVVIVHSTLLKTSLLHRLQAQTLPDATLSLGKINPFNEMTVTFDPLMKY